jgi:DNA-directed RNA polymerase alpha subunit
LDPDNIDEVCSATPSEFLRTPGLGLVSYKEIENKLHSMGRKMMDAELPINVNYPAPQVPVVGLAEAIRRAKGM